jgi:hypothetical protein
LQKGFASPDFSRSAKTTGPHSVRSGRSRAAENYFAAGADCLLDDGTRTSSQDEARRKSCLAFRGNMLVAFDREGLQKMGLTLPVLTKWSCVFEESGYCC